MIEKKKTRKIFGMTLENFLQTVKPSHIKQIHAEKKFFYYDSSKKKSQMRGYIDVITDSKEDQVLHCTNCEEDAVQWNGQFWICSECGTKNDYPI
jgi:hypothetical protein